jgi:hypothetical protein
MSKIAEPRQMSAMKSMLATLLKAGQQWSGVGILPRPAARRVAELTLRSAFLVLAFVCSATGAERLADPTKAFVEGYDPSGNDFLANVPERTVLLRIRADLDGDGRPDLALSDSSTWGNAGGQWLLFRGQPAGDYVYWGTLFFAPGSAALLGRGELAVYVRTGVSRGTLETYRFTATGIAKTATRAMDLEAPGERQRHDAMLESGERLPVEFCKLIDYRRDPVVCWRPGLGLR